MYEHTMVPLTRTLSTFLGGVATSATKMNDGRRARLNSIIRYFFRSDRFSGKGKGFNERMRSERIRGRP